MPVLDRITFADPGELGATGPRRATVDPRTYWPSPGRTEFTMRLGRRSAAGSLAGAALMAGTVTSYGSAGAEKTQSDRSSLERFLLSEEGRSFSPAMVVHLLQLPPNEAETIARRHGYSLASIDLEALQAEAERLALAENISAYRTIYDSSALRNEWLRTETIARESLGFQTDPEALLRMLDTAASSLEGLSSSHGLLLDAQETEQFERQMSVQAAIDSLEPTFRNSPAYGGHELDHAEGAALTVYLVPGQDAAELQLKRWIRDRLPNFAADVVYRPVVMSFSDLLELKTRISAQVAAAGVPAERSLNLESSTVHIVVSSVADVVTLQNALASQSPSLYEIVVDAESTENIVDATLENDSATPPWRGGHGIRDNSGTSASCSLGAAVESTRFGNQVSHYLTAGHCFLPWSGAVWHGTQEAVGTRDAWLFPGSEGDLDFGVGNSDNRFEIYAQQWKNRNSGTVYDQKGAWTPSKGDYVCNSGATSDLLRCGTINDSSADFTVLLPGGGSYEATDVVVVGIDVNGGDSGAAWFEVNSSSLYAYIDGIHSFSNAGGTNGTSKFVKWSNRPPGWGLTVATK